MVNNFQEARALLGRVEYQRGHIEEALRVFDGIKVSTLIPEMKISIARKVGQQKPRPYSSSPALSFHAVTVLMETIYLKALVLNDLGRFEGRDPASLFFFFFALLCFSSQDSFRRSSNYILVLQKLHASAVQYWTLWNLLYLKVCHPTLEMIAT